jgi:hypothetical protein
MHFFFVILPSSLHDVPITDAAPPVETFRSRDEPSPPQLTMTDAITKTQAIPMNFVRTPSPYVRLN